MSEMNVEEIRKDFPILSSIHNGRELVYLDNAATSQKPQSVIDSIHHYYSMENANIHRGIYKLSIQATENYERARLKIGSFLNAPCGKSVIFTRGTTEGINIISQVWGRENISRGDEIAVTLLEHHSNLVPWQILAREKKANLVFLPLKDDTTLDLERCRDLITHRTKLVAISQMSNVTGTIFDIKPIIKMAREVGAFVLLDGAQGASHIQTDLRDLDVDFYAFSAHKMLGPTGLGVLYGREEIFEKMGPWMGGGDMIESVERTSFTCAPLPAKLEAGTPHIAGAISFAKSIEYLQKIGLKNIHEHEVELVTYCLERMKDIPNLHLYGTQDLNQRGGVVSFNLEGIHPHDVGAILDEDGICIRVGHHCCQPFMKSLQIPGTCRASFYLYNTKKEIDRLIEGLEKVARIFSRATRKA
jgi:cysteine desulfurase/selenocysteine lyase